MDFDRIPLVAFNPINGQELNIHRRDLRVDVSSNKDPNTLAKCLWYGRVMLSIRRLVVFSSLYHKHFFFRTASCIICMKIAPMFAELELTWRDVASEQVGVSSYLVTDSPLRIFISWFFWSLFSIEDSYSCFFALIRLTHYSVLSHPDSHIASIITLFNCWK